MMGRGDFWRRLLPGLWAGMLLCVALVATPAPFATLAVADAGRVVARIFVQEAYFSVAMALLLVLMERGVAIDASLFRRHSRLNAGTLLALAALMATLLGYFGLQPLLAGARAGEGAFSFDQLHAISLAFFTLKLACVLALTVRAVRQL